MVSRAGQAARFHESQARSMGRDGGHARNERPPPERVLAMDVARDDQELLVVTENGYGKRTPIGHTARPGAAPWASRRSR